MSEKNQKILSLANYVNLERLIFLVDGVFAITMTLLVLELRLPEAEVEDFSQSLRDMLPRLFIYLIAFYSIANHWIAHQRMFRRITDADTTLVWLTLLWLLFLTLIPAATAIVGRFPAEKLAAACFSINSFLQAGVSSIFWRYVLKNHERYASDSDPRLLRITSQVWLLISGGWLISVALGFIQVNFAYISWVVWPNLAAVWGSQKRKTIPELEE